MYADEKILAQQSFPGWKSKLYVHREKSFQVTGVNVIRPTLQPARVLIDIFPEMPVREKCCATCFPATLAISRYRSTFNAPWSRPAASWLAIAICTHSNCGDTAACTVCCSLLSRPPPPSLAIRSRALCYAKQNREINPRSYFPQQGDIILLISTRFDTQRACVIVLCLPCSLNYWDWLKN